MKVTWHDKDIEDMSRDELVEAVKSLAKLYEVERDAANHYRAHQFDWTKIDWVADAKAKRDEDMNTRARAQMLSMAY